MLHRRVLRHIHRADRRATPAPNARVEGDGSVGEREVDGDVAAGGGELARDGDLLTAVADSHVSEPAGREVKCGLESRGV